MTITFQTGSAQTDARLVPVAQTDTLADTLTPLAERLNLPAAPLRADFRAEAGEVLPLYAPTGERTYWLGLGRAPKPINWLKAIREFFFRYRTKLPAHVAVDLSGFDGLPEDVLEAVGLGIRGGGYDLRLYQTAKTDAAPALFADAGRVSLVLPRSAAGWADNVLNRAEVLAQSIRTMLDWMNAPASHKSPEQLADWTRQSGRRYGYAVTVLDQTELERQGLGALLSVSRGSAVPPALIVADYQPPAPADVPATRLVVGLVGKGVTFDTGGVSIKDSTNMHYMKSDMGGAAAVLGTVEVAARLGLPLRVIGVVPATENSTDGRSTKPGDVVTSYSGKTIEVIDTDAEGRVILADGLGYLLRNYQPDVVVDLATLTGNVIAALGYAAGGLFTQNDSLAAELTAAGDRTGERLWRLPIWDAYADDIKSDVADVKNFSGKPVAGAIAAAKFLEFFTEGHPAWAHLDIAGVAFGETEFGTQKNATGFGIRLLVDWLRQLSANSQPETAST